MYAKKQKEAALLAEAQAELDKNCSDKSRQVEEAREAVRLANLARHAKAASASTPPAPVTEVALLDVVQVPMTAQQLNSSGDGGILALF